MTLSLIILTFFSSTTVMAKGESIDLTIKYVISDVKFNLYKFANINKDNKLEVIDELKGYPIDVTDVDATNIRALETTLSAYIKKENLKSTYTSISNEKNEIIFNNVSEGAYLLVGESKVYQNELYTPSPTIVFVKKDDLKNGKKIIEVKYEKVPKDTFKSIEVVKAWDDNDNANRPKFIEVQLLENGKVIDTVKLDKSNNWKYKWDKLSNDKHYEVVEKNVPNGYKVTISRNNNIFTVTNKLPNIPPTKPPTKPGKKLPQTGQLWWPLPILLLASIIFIKKGNSKRNDRR